MWTKFLRLFFPCLVNEPKRARYMDGRLKGDDKKTPTINEAGEVQSVTQLFLRHDSGLLDEAISKLHEVESLIQKAENEERDNV